MKRVGKSNTEIEKAKGGNLPRISEREIKALTERKEYRNIRICLLERSKKKKFALK